MQKEIKNKEMKLFEIVNTKQPITWKIINNSTIGSFTFDDNNIDINLDEYDVKGYTLLDFGFQNNGSIQALNSKTNTASILGIILNGAVPKIIQYNPDVILVAVMKGSGLEDSRKNLYETLIKWLVRKVGIYNHSTIWVENSKGWFKLISKQKLKEQDLELFISTVNEKD